MCVARGREEIQGVERMWTWTCRIYVCVYEIRTGRLGFTMEFGGPFFALL
jgi:hypothetical protein